MLENTHCFFAASNSFDGFVSYFGEIFSPPEYESMYILKGGPGTGKSSFMKDILNSLQPYGVKIEAILCSSDPKSLDGLIIEKESQKIAIIDGTAPHATDPTHPGAIEKIVNLGEFWNGSVIKSNREKIVELTSLKKQFYTNAYEYLSVAKKLSDIVLEDIKEVSLPTSELLESYIVKNEKDNGDVKTRLYSAFGKDGFTELPLPTNDKTKIVSIVGIYGSEYLVMENIYLNAKRSSLNFTFSPSPLDKRKTDAIILTESNTVFSAGRRLLKSDYTIDTSKFINVKKLDCIRNKIETLYKERESMLWCAADEFKKAYDTHLALEKIYTAAMNFKRSRKIFDKVHKEIKSTLRIEDINT